MENHHRIGGTVKIIPANATVHNRDFWSRIITNIISIPAFSPAVNIIFSIGLRVSNPTAFKKYVIVDFIFLLENSRSTRRMTQSL